MHLLNTLPQRLDPGATPTFAGLIAPSLTAPAATNLTLAGGTAGSDSVVVSNTLAASSAIIGAFKVGNGTAATNVAIGGGNVWAGGNARIGGNSLSSVDGGVGADFAVTSTSVANVAGFLQGSAGRGIQLYQNGYVASTTGGSWNVSATTAGATMSVATNGSASGGALSFSSPTSVKVLNTTAGASNAGALVVAGGISAGNTGSAASYFGGAVEITGATTLNNDVYQTALKKFYVDSGSNTYFHENSADSFQIVTGGTIAFTLTGSSGLFNGTVIAPAATATKAPLRIPHGTAPTSPTDGDMWTTNVGLFIRINGATVGPLS